jgi:hypothetical protein
MMEHKHDHIKERKAFGGHDRRHGGRKLKMKETARSPQRTNRQLMKEIKQKLTLDRPATYEITVPGHLDESWSEWSGGMTMAIESEDDGPPVTTITVSVDQAALQGLLRRLYSLGLPLISVNCVECC